MSATALCTFLLWTVVSTTIQYTVRVYIGCLPREILILATCLCVFISLCAQSFVDTQINYTHAHTNQEQENACYIDAHVRIKTKCKWLIWFMKTLFSIQTHTARHCACAYSPANANFKQTFVFPHILVKWPKNVCSHVHARAKKQEHPTVCTLFVQYGVVCGVGVFSCSTLVMFCSLNVFTLWWNRNIFSVSNLLLRINFTCNFLFRSMAITRIYHRMLCGGHSAHSNEMLIRSFGFYSLVFPIFYTFVYHL